MVQFGPDYDLATRLKRVEDYIARQQSNPIGQAFSATQSDGSVGWRVYQEPTTGATAMVFYQGTTTARDPSTAQHPPLLYIGEAVAGGVFVDSAVIALRPTGTESVIIGNRGIQILDPVGNQVFGADEYGPSPSQVGLNSPWVGYGPAISSDATKWPQTTATTLSEVAVLQFPAQHRNITWSGFTYLDSGAGEVQVTINNGTAGAVHSVGSGFTAVGEAIDLNGGPWNFQEVLTLAGNAAVTSGAGPIYFGILGTWGQGSGTH